MLIRFLWLSFIFILLALNIPSAGQAAQFCQKVHHHVEIDLPEGKPLTSAHLSRLRDREIDPRNLVFLVKGSEGFVFLNKGQGTIIKLFEGKYYFDQLLFFEFHLAHLAEQAGFEVAKSETLNRENLSVQRKFYPDSTLQAYDSGLDRLTQRDHRQKLVQAHRKLAVRFQRLLRENFDFIDESGKAANGHFKVVKGEIRGEGRKYNVNLHWDNILVREDERGEFHFTIIDFY